MRKYSYSSLLQTCQVAGKLANDFGSKGKRMGGRGSGSWYRWDKKTTCEEVKRVDIRYMRKQGLLRPGCAGSLSWSCGDQPTGSIGYRSERNRLVLNYRHRSHGDDWQDVEESVQFDRTPCNYGGERQWFLCPDCRKRVAVLYGPGVRFLCRACYRLPNSSQHEHDADRMMSKARKIRQRLGGDGTQDFCIKPKGMHWKTFERMTQQAHEAEDAGWSAAERMFGCLR
jgi:hypothetical protein